VKVIEIMTRCEVDEHVVRVWSKAELTESGSLTENINIRHAYIDTIVQGLAASHGDSWEFTQRLAEEPLIAAFEILDDYGNGVVVYTEWP